jgi:hypothetical protein
MPAETLTAAVGQEQILFSNAGGCRAWLQTLFDKGENFEPTLYTPA